jgi:hypothetical protein
MDTIQVARQYLQALRECPAPEPESTSPARAALDPHVIRNLHAYVPLTPRTLRSQEAIWDAVGEWLDGWEAIGMLTAEASLGTWEVTSCIHVFGYCLYSRHRRWLPRFVLGESGDRPRPSCARLH